MEEPAIETLETSVDTAETPLETLETQLETAAPEHTTEDAPKKKGGRPAGAKSKAQGKPRPKRVAANKMRARALEEVAPPPPAEEGEELPRALPGSRAIPLESEINPRDRTSMMMMTMLRQQAAERRQRKTDLWKSWFR